VSAAIQPISKHWIATSADGLLAKTRYAPVREEESFTTTPAKPRGSGSGGDISPP